MIAAEPSVLTLRELTERHAPLLLLDACSAAIQVGLLRPGQPGVWACRLAEAGTGLFQALDALAIDLGEVRAFAFCEGPGSILGIRTAAMALRTWEVLAPRPMFSYQSLALAAAGAGRPAVTLIADARRGLWHRWSAGSPLQRVPAGDLAGPLGMPAGFRHWSPLPPGTETIPYDLPRLLGLDRVLDAPLFRPAPAPDAFLHEEPSYASWTPHVHRAP